MLWEARPYWLAEPALEWISRGAAIFDWELA